MKNYLFVRYRATDDRYDTTRFDRTTDDRYDAIQWFGKATDDRYDMYL